MSASEVLLLILALVIWTSVYLPVLLTVRIMLIGSTHPDTKANLIALFWPVTVPVGFVLLVIASLFRR